MDDDVAEMSVPELRAEVRRLREENDRLDRENRFVASYRTENVELTAAYRRGHDDALGMRNCNG